MGWSPYYKVYNTRNKQWLPFIARHANGLLERMGGYQFVKEQKLNDAILFSFDDLKPHPMHMRNVYFDLGMVWLDNNQIVIDNFIAYPDENRLYSSAFPSLYCIEYHPEWFELFLVGDKLKFFNKNSG